MFLFHCPLSDFYCLLSMEIPPFYLSSRLCELYLSFLTFKAVWKQDFLWKLSLPKLMNFTIHGYASKRKREIPIIDGDEMPLHWNESETTSVKENYILSQERISLYTSDMSNPLPLSKFVFKGKRAEIKLNNTKGIKSQWAPKGS